MFLWDSDKKRLSFGGILLLLFLLLTLINCTILSNPPYWDEIVGVHNQALYLAKHHFDIVSLFQEKQNYLFGGSGIYRIGIVPWIYALFYFFLPPVGAHIAGHLLNIFCISLAGTFLWVLLRKVCREGIAFAWVLIALSEPLIAGRMAAQDHDTVLLLVVMWSFYCFLTGRTKSALLLAVICGFVKMTGVILLLAYFAYFSYECACRIREKKVFSRAGATALLTLGLTILIYVLYYLSSTTIDGVYDGRLYSFGWGEVQFHIYYYYPYLTLWLILCLGAFAFRFFRDRVFREDNGKFLAIGVFLVGYFAAYFLAPYPKLPRYTCITIFPLFLIAGNLFLLQRERLQLALMLAVFLFNLGNSYGQAFPRFPDERHQIACYNERSREFLYGIELDKTLAALLEKEAAGRLIVCKWPYVQILGVPEFGYVKKALPHLRVVGNSVQYAPTSRQFDPDEMTLETLFLYSPRGFEFFHRPRFNVPLGAEVNYLELKETPRMGAILYSHCRLIQPDAMPKK